ncbi:MAG TPA: hypothetical protein VF824_09720 [Thermoanaerobaculia bacterium]|jgi:hypothetical protein
MEAVRLQLHHALQAAAGVGRTLLAPRPDDSHHSFVWDARRGALVQPEAGSGLRLRDLTLLHGDDCFPLRGRTLAEAYDFHESRAGRMLARPGEPLPAHPVAGGAAFDACDEDLVRYEAIYATAARVLERLRARLDGAGPVRVWPHHFDMALLVTRGETSFGIGMVPGDASISEPYWYVYRTPVPEGALPPLRDGAWWNEGWSGAVLRETVDEERIERFVDEAMRALGG